MKKQNMIEKINELILNGATKFKGTVNRSSGSKWISEITAEQLFNTLLDYKDINNTEITRTSDTTAMIKAYKDNDLIIFGTIEFY